MQLFSPPFCPWPACREHRRRTRGFRFRRHGVYTTARRTVPRFRCLACHRTFSRQTFSTSYYLKRPDLLRPLAAALVAGSALRQASRSLGCASSTAVRLAARLGRHALLLHARMLHALHGRLREAVVLDHFETFEFSQDYPFGVATPVGRLSWFAYAVDPAPHGRSGRLSPVQKARLRRRPARASRGGYRRSTRRTLAALLPLAGEAGPLTLVGDGHPAYEAVCRCHPRVRLRSHPNPRRGPKGSPRSREAVARDAAMFPVDLWHALLRHTLAHHRRESIAFGRRLNAVLERLYLAVVWRNLVKRRSERRAARHTPAMTLGLAEEPWSWKRVLSRRLFPGREVLPPGARSLYRRDWLTPMFTRNSRHQLRHAF